MKVRVFLFACLVLFGGCVFRYAEGLETTNTPHKVSLINLVATPEKYDGKIIIVTGFLNLEFEDYALYFHSEDYERALTANSITISVQDDPELKKLDKKYVVIQGVFRSFGDLRYSRGHGHIENIERIAELGGQFNVWKAKK